MAFIETNETIRRLSQEIMQISIKIKNNLKQKPEERCWW